MRSSEPAGESGNAPESLDGKRVAILALGSAGSAEALLRDALTAAGAVVENVHEGGWDAATYDGLVALGAGAAESETANDEVVELVRAFFSEGKPVALLGGAVGLLLAAGVVRDRTVTCVDELRTKVLDAGGNCVAYPVVADHGLVTGAALDDAEAFVTRAIVEFAVAPETPHDPRSTAPP